MSSPSNNQESKKVKDVFSLNTLTPVLLDEDKYGVKTYLESLKLGIDNKDVHDIALTGSYGSGKSSIIKTFQSKYSDKYSFINISLASFSKTKSKQKIGQSVEKLNGQNISIENDSKEEDNVDRLIELSILQQLFYRVNHTKTPYSRFRKIKNISFLELSNKALLLGGILIGLYFLFNTSLLKFYSPQNYYGVKIFVLILLLFTSHEVFIEVFKVLNLNKLSSLNLKDLEIGLSKDDEQSIFNKHLDEIIYFFEVTDYNVVVIEDLDRFGNTVIFTKLREINQLINNSEQVKRQINFVYAVKDELFKEKDSRIKFFDLIIPVVPVVNPSNSGEKAIEVINGLGESYKLDNDFLDVICSYIDDMRLLNNTCNEYVIYRKVLGSNLVPEKLFSMITYKNLYPDDFSKLHKDKGELYKLLFSKNKLISAKKTQIDEKIDEYNKKIADIEGEKLHSYEELKALYINQLFTHREDIIGVVIGGDIISIKQLKKNEYFNKFMKTKEINVFVHNHSYKDFSINHYLYPKTVNLGIGFSDLEKGVSNFSFNDRSINLFKEDIDKFNKKIKDLNIKKQEISQMSFQSLVNEIEIDEVGYEDKRLIVFLLKEGYVDEDYHDYISYFHGISITPQDAEYMRSIRSGFKPNYDYIISKPINFVKKLKSRDFNGTSVFNFSLLEFLLFSDSYSSEKNLFMKRLRSLDKSAIMFVDAYLNSKEDGGLVLQHLSDSETNLWESFSNNSLWTKSKDFYLELIVKNINVDKIKKIADSSNLKSYISDKGDFIYLAKGYEEKVIELISLLNIKFTKMVEPKEEEYPIYYRVFEGNYYKLNPWNIKLYMKHELGEDFNETEFNSYNYSYIKKTNFNFLINYVEARLEEYVDDVLLELDKGGESNEKYFLSLLNSEHLGESSKRELINVSDVKVELLSSLEDELLILKVFDEDKLIYNWHNIVIVYKYLEEAYEDEKHIEKIVSVLNKKEVYNEIKRNKLDAEGYDSEEYSRIVNSIMKNDSLSHSSFSSLLFTIGSIELDFDFTQLSDNKLEILVFAKLKLTPEIYNLLKKKNKKMMVDGYKVSMHIYLLEKYNKTLLENFDDYNVDSVDFLELIVRGFILEPQIILMLEKIGVRNIIENKECLKELSSVLIKEYYHGTDKYDLILEIFKLSEVLDSEKLNLMDVYFNDLSFDNLKSLFLKLPEPYSNVLKERSKRVKLPETPVNYNLIRKLKNKDYISSYKLLVNYIQVNAKNKY